MTRFIEASAFLPEGPMFAVIRSKRHDIAEQAVSTLRRAIQDLRKRLLAETDPVAYYCALAEAASAEMQLDYLCEQMDSAKQGSRFVGHRAGQRSGGSKKDRNNHRREP